jgi:uncharacterized protein
MRKFRPGISFVIPIIVLNIIVYIIQVTTGPGFTEALLLRRGDLWNAPWTLLTSMFLHGGGMHILFNMYSLLIFGPILEQKIGSKRFILSYLGAGLFASAVGQFFYDSALGASGAVMGIIGLTIFLMPNLPVLFFFIIPMPLWVAGAVMAALDIFGAVGIGQQGIANVAHLAGLGLGLLIGFFLSRQKQRFYTKFSQKGEMDDNDIDEYLKSGRI